MWRTIYLGVAWYCDTLFVDSGYRTDATTHAFLAETFIGRGCKIVPIQTIPAMKDGEPVTNKVSGWPDSRFYDIDLAMGIVRPPMNGQPGLIAWCSEVFTEESRVAIAALDIDKIEMDVREAEDSFACNFVSTGNKVIMGAQKLQAAIESYGFTTETLEIHELVEGGGFIRCNALMLDNA